MSHQQANLSEQDLLNDLLSAQKQLMNSYTLFISEASCPNLRNVLSCQLNEVTNDQYKIFNAMNQKGYYPTKDAPANEVQQAKQKATQMKQEVDSFQG
ncbi:MAG: spore coat protein [Christensenellales bacterium]|jgi:spore coat protein F